jgi:hypothetical protein
LTINLLSMYHLTQLDTQLSRFMTLPLSLRVVHTVSGLAAGRTQAHAPDAAPLRFAARMMRAVRPPLEGPEVSAVSHPPDVVT